MNTGPKLVTLHRDDRSALTTATAALVISVAALVISAAALVISAVNLARMFR